MPTHKEEMKKLPAKDKKALKEIDGEVKKLSKDGIEMDMKHDKIAMKKKAKC